MPRPEQHSERNAELAGWLVNIVTYRLGSRYYTTVENTDPGAWIVKVEGSTKKEAEAKALTEAEALLAKVKKIPPLSVPASVPSSRIQIGQAIPNFELEAFQNEQIKRVTLSEYRGKWLVLIFYPADFTFVCPTELVEVANAYEDFKKLGAEVLSVSTDTVFVHKAWRDQSPAIQKVEFPMLADPTGKLCRAFGTYLEAEGVSLRGSFLVDPDGTLKAFEVHDNSIGRSTQELLRKLQAAIFVRENPGEVCPASWSPGQDTLKPSLALVGKL